MKACTNHRDIIIKAGKKHHKLDKLMRNYEEYAECVDKAKSLSTKVDVLNKYYDICWDFVNEVNDSNLKGRGKFLPTIISDFIERSFLKPSIKYDLQCGTEVPCVFTCLSSGKIIKKNVDCCLYVERTVFCETCNIPIVYVENKKYCDATMFTGVSHVFNKLKNNIFPCKCDLVVEDNALDQEYYQEICNNEIPNCGYYIIRRQRSKRNYLGNYVSLEEMENFRMELQRFVDSMSFSNEKLNVTTRFEIKEKDKIDNAPYRTKLFN